MIKFALQKEQHKAETLWVLKCVMSHFSFSSSTDITDIFMAMIPDGVSAQKLRFGPKKLFYLICFGITPYFKQKLIVELKETQCFDISFDETLDNEFHKEQMDFFVRYVNRDSVVCRYLTSRFLGHTCAEDLKKESKNWT